MISLKKRHWVIVVVLGFSSVPSRAVDALVCESMLNYQPIGVMKALKDGTDTPFHFPLDSRTISDLDLPAVLHTMYGPWLPRTIFGYKRLEYLIRNPFIHPGVIQLRQGIVKKLVEDDIFREGLRKLLLDFTEEIDASLYDHLMGKGYFSPQITNLTNKKKSSVRYILLTSFIMGMNIYLSGIQGGLFPGIILIPTLINLNRQASAVREGFAKYGHCFKYFRGLSDLLKNAGQPYLGDMGTVLNALETEPKLQEVQRTARGIPKGVGWNLLDILFGLGFHLGDRMETMMRPQAEQIALFYAILAELDVFLTFADTYRAYSDSMIFPEILNPLPIANEGEAAPSPRYEVSLQEGHHPIVYFSEQTPSMWYATNGNPPSRITVTGPRVNRVSVSNGIEIATYPQNGQDSWKNTVVITGPNKAGKSTFIRMVGVTAILAQMGSPVFAQKYRATPLKVITSIENKDSTQLGKSYFDSESDRVLEIERLLGSTTGVLAILDEIFRGTNPAEKHAMEQAYLEAFATQQNIVFLATHDQSLSGIAEKLEHASNVHVDAVYESGKFAFDYKIKSGPATSTNAIDLMEFKGADKKVIRRAREILQEPHAPSR